MASDNIQVGDIVGLYIHVLNKKREIKAKRVVVVGEVLRVYRLRPGARLRADVKVRKQDKHLWFIYSGKVDWAWLHELVLVRKKDSTPPASARVSS